MANSVTTQTLLDGPLYAVVKVVGILDTSDLAATAIVDPATLAYMDNTNQQLATRVSIDKIQWSVEEGLDVRLEWDATTPVYIVDLVKTSVQDYKDFGGLQNNAGTGVTGKILAATEGWTTGVHEFTLILTLKKHIPNGLYS